MYDATFGRFLQRDPAAASGETDLYQYASSNPADFSDVLGLEVTFEGTKVTQQGKESSAQQFIITTIAQTKEEWEKRKKESAQRRGAAPVAGYTESFRQPKLSCQAKGKTCVITLEKLVYWAEIVVPGVKVSFPGPQTAEALDLMVRHETFHAQHNLTIARNYAAALTKERTCTYDVAQTDESCRAKAKEVENFIIQQLTMYQHAAGDAFHSRLGGMGEKKEETAETQAAGDAAALAYIKTIKYQDWSCPK
jgi:hypothetical protein